MRLSGMRSLLYIQNLFKNPFLNLTLHRQPEGGDFRGPGGGSDIGYINAYTKTPFLQKNPDFNCYFTPRRGGLEGPSAKAAAVIYIYIQNLFKNPFEPNSPQAAGGRRLPWAWRRVQNSLNLTADQKPVFKPHF